MTPPVHVIRRTEVTAATRRACAKVARAAAVYSASSGVIYGLGVNGPPTNVLCRRTPACAQACGKVCEHAEARAIHEAMQRGIWPWHLAERAIWPNDLELVHVRIDDPGKLAAGRGPRCIECARLALEVGWIRGVWLYEAQTFNADNSPLHGMWRRYAPLEFYELALKARGIEL